jgi:hypothetical protein
MAIPIFSIIISYEHRFGIWEVQVPDYLPDPKRGHRWVSGPKAVERCWSLLTALCYAKNIMVTDKVLAGLQVHVTSDLVYDSVWVYDDSTALDALLTFCGEHDVED